jgi:hypothetical protein
VENLTYKISESGSIPCEVSAVVKNLASGEEYSVQKSNIFSFLRSNRYVRKSGLFSVQNVEALEVCYVQTEVQRVKVDGEMK